MIQAKVNAVIRSLEVIGEVTKKLPTSLKDSHPDVPWKQMARMHDKLIHEYFGTKGPCKEACRWPLQFSSTCELIT